MALTATERKVLERARRHLVNRSTDFICHGLYFAGRELCATKAASRLIRYVQRKLGNHVTTIQGWQEVRGIVHSREQRRADRIAWIDWMLDQ